jgi:hypothetical protein
MEQVGKSEYAEFPTPKHFDPIGDILAILK